MKIPSFSTFILGAALLIPAVLTGCGGGGSGSTNGTTTTTAIVFVSERDGNPEIYRMNADGSAQTRLTTTPGSEEQPRLSRDGSRIVFSGQNDGNAEIYTMNADGSSLQRLTNDTNGANAPSDFSPTFSPDRATIAWTTTRGDGLENIFLMDSNGANQRRIAAGRNPSFSPDGTLLAYSSPRTINGSSRDVIVIRTLSTGAERILDPNRTPSINFPRFSPDGARLLYAVAGRGGSTIYSIRTDGSDITATVLGPGDGNFNSSPSWSNTGGLVVFESAGGQTPTIQIFSTNATTFTPNRVLTTQGINRSPSFGN